jgi:hypothetical protein
MLGFEHHFLLCNKLQQINYLCLRKIMSYCLLINLTLGNSRSEGGPKGVHKANKANGGSSDLRF